MLPLSCRNLYHFWGRCYCCSYAATALLFIMLAYRALLRLTFTVTRTQPTHRSPTATAVILLRNNNISHIIFILENEQMATGADIRMVSLAGKHALINTNAHSNLSLRVFTLGCCMFPELATNVWAKCGTHVKFLTKR